MAVRRHVFQQTRDLLQDGVAGRVAEGVNCTA